VRRLGLVALGIVAVTVAAIVLPGPSQGAGGNGNYNVRAIFDDAAFAVPGEDVRIAGAPVGSISSLDVTPDHKAAVTLAINSADFTPFHANATCEIRPQSLIAERYVDCNPGTANTPALARIEHGPGAGSYLLPVTQTRSPIDPDIVASISQESLRQRLSLILVELGTGLAARGSDLNAVIHRADPALGYTDQVFKILARQSRVLAQLATDSDTVLKPLAKARQELAGFVVQANTTALASAARAADISRGIKLLPTFLTQLKPLMADLGSLADQGTPLMASLSQAAAGINAQFRELIPFAGVARTALINLGNAAAASQAPLLASQSLANRLLKLGNAAEPSSKLLDQLTASLDNTGGIEQLMGVLFHGVGATNGFNADGHYTRANALVGSCFGYTQTPVPGCSANFNQGSSASAARAARATAHATASASAPSSSASARRPSAASATQRAVSRAARAAVSDVAPRRTSSEQAQQAPLDGLLGYLIGGGR
jgi:ABC-type transporter Mla subunit MlaD